MNDTNAVAQPAEVIAAGELLWDMLPGGARLGGAPGNFALGCARLGRRAALISCVGADTLGEQARTLLAEEAAHGGALPFSTALIQTAPTTPTGVVDVLVTENGVPSYVIAEPAAWDRIAATPEALRAAAGARAFCFGTLAQREATSREAVRALVQATPARCLRLLDTNIRMPFATAEVVQWSLAHASVAKISDEEMDFVARAVDVEGLIDPHTPPLAALERCGREILARFPQLNLLAITMGPRGSLLLAADEAHYHPGVSIMVRDTVGAGDAFTAGLVHGCLEGRPLPVLNEIGNLCGSFGASSAGATPVFPP